jgi:hypothetical protein
MKLKRVVSGQSTAVDMTDDLYAKLSKSQQLIAAIAESLNIVPKIATYEGRKYVAGDTIDKIVKELS